jgi:phytoene synthase
LPIPIEREPVSNETLYPTGFQPDDPEQVLAYHGKSFNWAKWFLGQTSARAAARLYQFCRYVDDLADDPDNDHTIKLEEIRSLLTVTGDPNATEDLVVMDFLKLVEEQNLPILAAVSLLDGVLSDRSFVNSTNEADLIRYCYHVAGTVGLLMCPILGNNSKAALAHAIDLGIAMQLTNICRDVLEDAKQGRCYIPFSGEPDMAKKIITAVSDESDPIRNIITKQIEYWLDVADQYYASGIDGLWHLSKSGHCGIYLAAKIYRRIGMKLRRQGSAWWHGRVVVSSLEKFIITIYYTPRLILPFLLMGNSILVGKKNASHKSFLHKHLCGLPHANRD